MMLMIIVFPVRAGAPPPAFTLDIHDALVDLAAEDAPLREILQEISRKTGLTLRSADQATELVSCQFHAVSLAEGLEKLLSYWNYALLYKKDGQGRSVPDILWVINRKPHPLTSDNMEVRPRLVRMKEKEQPPMEDHLRKYKKEDVAAVFADSEKVLLDIDAKPVAPAELIDEEPSSLANEPPPLVEQQEGIKITRLSRTSPLSEIGLQEGDQVMDVNGEPVGSAGDLVRGLAAPPADGVSVIRINRLRNGKINPIYLELQ